jgi:hypothetical protein
MNRIRGFGGLKGLNGEDLKNLFHCCIGWNLLGAATGVDRRGENYFFLKLFRKN